MSDLASSGFGHAPRVVEHRGAHFCRRTYAPRSALATAIRPPETSKPHLEHYQKSKIDPVYGLAKNVGVVGDWDDEINKVSVECSRADRVQIEAVGLTIESERVIKTCPLA